MKETSAPVWAAALIAALAAGSATGQADREAGGGPLYPIEDEVGGKWGYINRSGEVVIEPQYDIASEWYENGTALVASGGVDAVIDNEGKVLCEKLCESQRYVGAGLYACGRSAESGESYVKVFNAEGEEWRGSPLQRVGRLHEGLAKATPMAEGRAPRGYLNREGEWVIEPQFGVAHRFSEGKAFVAVIGDGRLKNGRVINKEGETVIRGEFYNALWYSDGLLPVARREEGEGGPPALWGYMDHQGEMVIDYRFSKARTFSDGLAPVTEPETGWGYIDKRGEYVILPKLARAHPFQEGRSRFKRVNEAGELVHGFVDTDGNVVATFHDLPRLLKGKEHPFGSHEITDFVNGLARVVTEDRYGYVDRSGEWVWFRKRED